MTDAPAAGEVWHYPYLWAWQDERGETEGRKNRPATVAVTIRRADGQTIVYLLAVATHPPGKDRAVLEVPDTEKRRANLSLDKRLWIVLDEYNSDVFEASYYLEPDARTGTFGATFLKQIQSRFRGLVRQSDAQGIRRSDD